MFAKYIVRLDDACETMDKDKWNKIENILDKYNVKPLVAVVPNNKDKKLIIDNTDSNFWNKVKLWQEKNWDLALHGYDHVYTQKGGGIVPINDKSEFTNLSFKEQSLRIKKGISIFYMHDIFTNIWIAPSHSFDENTLLALKKESNIDTISDGISIFPFKDKEFKWIPQQMWHFRKMFFGVWTGCFHPNTMDDKQIKQLEHFIKNNHKNFITAREVDFSNNKNILDMIFEKIFWFLKKRRR